MRGSSHAALEAAFRFTHSHNLPPSPITYRLSLIFSLERCPIPYKLKMNGLVVKESEQKIKKTCL
jgi:hypothetical protein